MWKVYIRSQADLKEKDKHWETRKSTVLSRVPESYAECIGNIRTKSVKFHYAESEWTNMSNSPPPARCQS